MIIGKLNHRVTLLQYTVVSEDVGFGPQKDWAEVATVWAQVHAPRIQAVAAVGSGDAVIITQGITIRKRDDIEKGWATPSWEEVVERDPDVILILDYDYDTEAKTEFLKTNEFTSQLRAVKEGRIYSACCSDMQGSAGSAGTVEIMAKQFYPEKFN